MSAISKLFMTPTVWTILAGITTTFMIYLLYRHQKAKKYVTYIKPSAHLNCQSVIVDKEKGIRTAAVKLQPAEQICLRTMKDIFSEALKKFRNNKCFGTRKDFTSESEWNTYEQSYQIIQEVGSALVYLSEPCARAEKFIGIYGRNAPEWVCTFHACGNYGLIAVPLYDTLGTEALDYILRQTELSIVICDTTKRARNLLGRSSPFLKHIVIWQNEPDLIELRIQQHVIQVMSFDELLAVGKCHWISESDVQTDDLCMVCYTSGSTGLPKGVMYTHGQFTSGLTESLNYLSEIINEKTSELHLSYLPLSHVMEQFAMNLALILGLKIAFLTTDISGLMRDLTFYKPTVFCAVPRILSRMYLEACKRYHVNVITRWFFQFAIRQKLAEQARGIYSRYGLLDSLYFKPFRQQMGDRIAVVICGSAPLSPEASLFSRAVFSCPVIEGYGSTESGGVATMCLIGDQNVGHTGAIGTGIQIKLADVPDMDIIASRDGLGEICVLSSSMTKGYYKDEAKTKELFDKDGFLRMGDVGRWTENGSLKIVDRCKNIFKLAQGEYVAPEKVEQIYGCSPLVVNVYVEGNSLNTFVVGVVVPEMRGVRARLRQMLSCNRICTNQSGSPLDNQPWDTLTDAEICNREDVKQMILKELTDLGKQKGLNGFEQIKALYLSVEPFSIPNGLLTPTMKIARVAVRRHFCHVVDEMYKSTFPK